MLWALVGLGLLLAVLLLAPLRLRAEAATDPVRLRVELGLLGGLLPLALVDSTRARKPARAKPETARPAKKKRRPSAKMLRAGARAGLEALGCLRIDRLRGEARIGLGDPALTGEFWGRASGILIALPWRGFRLVPLFDRQALEGEGEIALSVIPARLLPVLARFVWRLR
ncbi:hypothetical protein [Pararhodobacter aggregans]|uniref:hypothetical protein n=1 Tax=Pararhodobacter aggregans TaxID=404875 RepID=UPI003A916E5A